MLNRACVMPAGAPLHTGTRLDTSGDIECFRELRGAPELYLPRQTGPHRSRSVGCSHISTVAPDTHFRAQDMQ